MPVARTRMTTSSGPGSGAAMSVSIMALSPSKKAAFIWGMGRSFWGSGGDGVAAYPTPLPPGLQAAARLVA